MKILISRIHGGSLGGAEMSAWLHWRVFRELGHEPKLYTNAGLPNIRKAFVPTTKLLRWLWCLVYLPLKVLLGSYDIVNPHSREDQIAFTLSKWLHRTPVVWKDPGDLVHNIKLNRKGVLGSLNQHLLIATIKRADAIYTLNEEDRATILSRLEKLGNPIDPSKLVAIPSDILFEDYDLKANPPKATDKLVIGTVIRLDEHKGVQHLLAAAKELNKQHQELEFWVVGDGPYRLELEKMASSLDNVTFWGNQADISPYLASIDIFVQPAETEGWGRNVKEAMFFGKPVVGSNTGGIALQVEDGKTGLLFEPKNVNQLERQLVRLIESKSLRDKFGQAARSKTLKDGDFMALAKTKILPLFMQVLEKNNK